MGNKVGWILAGVLTVGLLGVIAFKMFVPSPSEPSRAMLQSATMDLAIVDFPIRNVLGWEPSESGNAGDDYARAVRLLNEKRSELAQSGRNLDEILDGTFSPPEPVLDTLKKIDAFIAAGSRKKTMRYTLVHTPAKLGVYFIHPFMEDLCSHRNDPEPPSLSLSLEILGRVYVARRDYAAAESVFQHELMLGRHMMEERSLAGMIELGLRVQDRALDGLGSVYDSDALNRPDRVKAVNGYYNALKDAWAAYDTKARLLRKVSPNPGDVFYLIKNDKDRAWRAQGLLTLGIVRFTSRKRGDASKTASLLEKFASGKDPIEAAAAKAAKNLTVEEFRQLGSRF